MIKFETLIQKFFKKKRFGCQNLFQKNNFQEKGFSFEILIQFFFKKKRLV